MCSPCVVCLQLVNRRQWTQIRGESCVEETEGSDFYVFYSSYTFPRGVCVTIQVWQCEVRTYADICPMSTREVRVGDGVAVGRASISIRPLQEGATCLP
jgi:hypothetical protein